MKDLRKIDLLYYSTGFTIIISFLIVVAAVVYRFLKDPGTGENLFIHLMGIIEGSFVTGLVGYFFVKSKIDRKEVEDPKP